MQRSIWIGASALYCFAGAALALVGLTRFGGISGKLTHPAAVYDIAVLFWLVLTGIGLLRRWPWSRISIQILAALDIYLGVVNALGPVPSSPTGLVANGAHVLLGMAWLVLFNLPQIKGSFTPSNGRA